MRVKTRLTIKRGAWFDAFSSREPDPPTCFGWEAAVFSPAHGVVVGAETIGDFTKFEQNSGLAPATLREMPIGVQGLAARLSAHAVSDFLKTDFVPVLVETIGSQSPSKVIADFGFQGDEISPTTIVARIPRSRLRELADLHEVRFVEASTRLQPHCDLAHMSAGLVRAGVRTVTETGRGVLLGVVDTGIDTKHPAFEIDGKSRIVDYFDQVSGRRFGPDEIANGTAALQAPDLEGHGTHVTGIAAGNGNGSTSNTFAGVASESDIAVVRTTFDTADIARGVKHIYMVATERKQPCVINLSLGGHFGAHDGTSILERTIDQLSGPGRVVVASAGNDGGAQLHAELTFPTPRESPGRVVADFTISPRNIGTTLVGLIDIQVWAQREDRIKISIRFPSGEVIALDEETQFNVNRGNFTASGVHSRGIYNDDHVYTIRIVTIPNAQWLSGWSLIAEEPVKGSAPIGKLHAWISGRGTGNFVTANTRSHLVAMPGTAYSAICVASFASRREWESQDLAGRPSSLDAIQLGDISHFSSPGPARDGSTKPEVSAPGQYLVAPLSESATPEQIEPWLRLRDQQYAAMQGTSMASPYVAGAVALLLQRFPDLDWAEVKRRLIRSANQNGLTGSCWNERWGYGIVDVSRLLTIDPGPSV
jgi:subtilisin family serine protease